MDKALRLTGRTFPKSYSAVEIGCGNGGFLIPFTQWAAKQGQTPLLYGTDIASNAIAEAKQRPTAIPVQYLLCDVDEFEPVCDYVLVMDVIEHVDAPTVFLRSCRRVGKVLVLHVPIEHSLLHSLVRRPTTSYHSFRHIHFFSVETVEVALRESGWRPLGHTFTAGSRSSLTLKTWWGLKFLRYLRFLAYQIAPRFTSLIAGGSVTFVCERAEPAAPQVSYRRSAAPRRPTGTARGV